MKIQGNKTLVIASVLMLTIAVTLVALPAVTAQAPRRKTFAFINAVPNPVGVGQTVLLHVGITQALGEATQGWEGLTVTVERPDGTTETLGPYRTDSTGGTGAVYVPDQVGTYYLQTNFPETVLEFTIYYFFEPPIPEGTVMEASTSDKLALIVQTEPIEYHPGFLLPTEYWTRPIDAQLREWYSIAGSWIVPSTFYQPPNLFAPYNDDAPETAHILWTKPHTIGGLVGGALGDPVLEALGYHSFELGDAYEPKFGNRFILAGRLYYDKYAEPERYHEIVCVDIHTGEEMWSKVFLDNRTIARGQLLYWDTYDYHGVYDYLWVTIGSTWHAFDSFTGDWVYTLTDMPSGTIKYGPKGEILIYRINLAEGWMALWNSTNIPALYASTVYGSMGWGQWRPMGKTVNATDPIVSPTTPLGIAGYEWNVTIPTDLPGSIGQFLGVEGVLDDRVIGAEITTTEVNSWGLSLKPGLEGSLLFSTTWTPPADWAAGDQTITLEATSSQGKDGVFVLGARESRTHYGFSTETGEFLWQTEPEHYLNWYGISRERPPLIAYGKMFASGIAGIVYCYDVKTGETLWTYEAVDPYQEFLFGNNWWLYPLFITDGKIYYGHVEHSPISPRPRGAPFICLDVETGEEIFRIDGAFRQSLWGGRAIIGDSIIATQDTYDQRVYAIGRGPSATTVSIQNDVITQGSSVLIKGRVTDESPGTKDPALKARFPDGVPAIADEFMSEWMLYVYKQFPAPMDATGVDVLLQAMSSDGTITDIATVTSDAYGCFSYKWTPPDEDVYTIMAIFLGSKSYWASYAQTGLGVTAAPPEPPEPPVEEAPAYTAIDLAIIAAVVVVAILVLYTLYTVRKQRK